MKISMWMLAEKLERYQPECDIKDGTARITGVRFDTNREEDARHPDFVYLDVHKHNPGTGSRAGTTSVINGKDSILLHSQDVNEILNDLLAAFDFYNSWEKALWEASAHKSFQQIIDLGDSVLENPMMVSDMDGNVLAMSSSFVDEDINEYWVESRNSRHVPTAILGAPMRTLDGELTSWKDTPEIYLLPDGTKTIGTFISVDGGLIAGFGLWEHKKPIIPSDIWLVQVLYEVLVSTLEAQQRSAPLRSNSTILGDLLAGIQVDDDLIQHLEHKAKCPWKLLVIDNPFRSDVIYQRNLIQRLESQVLPSVSVLYEGYIVALVSAQNAQTILDSVLGTKKKQYYLAASSLPFEDLRNLRIRYAQTVYAIKCAGSKPGFYQAEDFAFQYLLSLFMEQNTTQGLIHPVLTQLKQHDTEKNSELYETLYQYLLNERSVIQSAQAMHVHKNSLMYRLQRIQAIINTDLEDPMIRTYLLLSYLMDKA